MDPSDVIKKWLSNYDTIEFLGLWEELSNEDFNSAEFSLIKNDAPKKSFTMSPSQWCTRVNAKGITSSKGKYSIRICILVWLKNLKDSNITKVTKTKLNGQLEEVYLKLIIGYILTV